MVAADTALQAQLIRQQPSEREASRGGGGDAKENTMFRRYFTNYRMHF